MAAKSNAVKKAEKLAGDKAKGVKNLTLPAMPATQAALAELLTRYDMDDWREVVTLLIHAAPAELPVPRHEYKPSEKVLKRLEREGILQAAKQDENDEN
jgi:hypothetical protein